MPTKAEAKWKGKFVGGCECLRLSDDQSKGRGQYFVFRCPYCNNEFIRSIEYMTQAAAKYFDRDLDCGCRKTINKRDGMLRNENHSVSKYGAAGDNSPYNPIYHAIYEAVQRTTNPDHFAYKNYGARGIKVLPPWYNPDEPNPKKRTNYDSAIDWYLLHGWTPGCDLTIERDQGNFDYGEDLCSLVTLTEQENNKRDTLCIEYKGRVYRGSDIVGLTGMAPSVLRTSETRLTLEKKWYESAHPDLEITYVNGRWVDQYGYMRLVPTIRMFPRYPDDVGTFITSYWEYVDRVIWNYYHKIEVIILDSWMIPGDFLDRNKLQVDINKESEYLVPWRTTIGDSERPNLKPRFMYDYCEYK